MAVLPTGERRDLKIEGFWFQKGRIVLKFEGSIRSRRRRSCGTPRSASTKSEAVELEEGEFFDWQLEGCTVETVEGERIGTVRETDADRRDRNPGCRRRREGVI